MGKPPHDPSPDTFRVCADRDAVSRADLDRIFKDGAKARRLGHSEHDNPYAAGSEEREEWRAGYTATPDLDADDDPGSPL